MPHVRRSLLAVAAVFAATLMAVSIAGSAQAATGSHHEPGGGQMRIAPSAPAAPDRLAAVASPTISPAARQIRYVGPGEFYNCDQGNLCTVVWDPGVGRYKIFDLYHCRTYSLSGWNGTGLYWNAQTGGAVARFYDRNFRLLLSAPVSVVDHEIDWTPVWYIRNC